MQCSMRAVSIITFLHFTSSSLAASSHRNLIRAKKKKKEPRINYNQILEYDKIGDIILLYNTTKNNIRGAFSNTRPKIDQPLKQAINLQQIQQVLSAPG